jgi:hypothetical protein
MKPVVRQVIHGSPNACSNTVGAKYEHGASNVGSDSVAIHRGRCGLGVGWTFIRIKKINDYNCTTSCI